MKSKKKAILLFSGGLDSATCLYWAREKGYNVRALIFHYGQRHNKEIKSAVRIAGMNKCRYHVMRIKLDWPAGTLLESGAVLPSRTLSKIKKKVVPSTYVPGRNTIFLSYGLSFCESIGAENIIIGANQVDYPGYPDCRSRYLKAYERMANIGCGFEGTRKRIRIIAPLIKKTKKEIVLAAVKLGVPIGLTWSCYKGGSMPCGRCDSCILRKEGFSRAGIEDPLN